MKNILASIKIKHAGWHIKFDRRIGQWLANPTDKNGNCDFNLTIVAVDLPELESSIDCYSKHRNGY